MVDYDDNIDKSQYLPLEKLLAEQPIDKNAKSMKRTTGPINSFVKTDKHANFKWGVQHFVGRKYH
jgi:hypothetical protein